MRNRGQWDANPLGGSDERDTTQGVAAITALVAGCAAALDEALAFVETQCRGRDAAAFGQFADRQPRVVVVSLIVTILLDLNLSSSRIV